MIKLPQTAETVVKAVEEVTGLDRAAFTSSDRRAECVRARAMLCHALSQIGYSRSFIARMVGRSHSSILRITKQHHAYMDDRIFRRDMSLVKSKVETRI